MKTLRERAQQHVSTNRVILVLLTTTVLMQAYIASLLSKLAGIPSGGC